ncbi:MAG TPA: hypothetical protein VHC71_14490 [Hyphomicrobium sp.]|nr:hypothetical protein [Hyphomicrobium sp.]
MLVQPIGWVVGALLLGGTFAALTAVFRRIGADRRANGAIETVIYYPDLRVLETAIRPTDNAWKGHKAGQFAFVSKTFRRRISTKSCLKCDDADWRESREVDGYRTQAC